MTTHDKEIQQGKGAPLHDTRCALFDLLRQDHDKARAFLETMGQSTENEVEIRQELFKEIGQELLVHMEVEERFLYTALEQHDESREKVLESFEQHVVVRTVIGAFMSLAVDDERWGPKLKVLRTVLRHHLDDEERELFPLASRVLGKEQLDAIAVKVRQVKSEARKG